MKKITALLLSLLLIFSVCATAFAAEDMEHPTIYVTGAQTNDLYNAQGKRIYPMDDDIEAIDVIKENLMPCLEKLAYGLIIDDYEEYAKQFYDAFVPIYDELALDKNGEVSDGSHPEKNIYNCDIPKKTSNYGEWDYRFWYDWRISPVVAAEELKTYIDMVKQATGEDKVNLSGRCYGCNVIAAYLVKYKEHALENVDDVAYLSSSILGIDMMSALFSGQISFNDQAITNFVDFFMGKENIIEDEALNVFVLSLVELFNQVKVLGITGEALEKLVDKVKYDLIPMVLRDTFGSMPSYWSMVTPELYEDAVEFIFGDCRDEYVKLIEKIDDFHYNVQVNVKQDMLKLKESGIDFQIFVKYNFPDYPLYKNATIQGDGTTAAIRQGFGGEYADFGKVFSEKYINSLEDKTYLSPDLKINAATCLFPENTWFIKNMQHDIFPTAINCFAMDVMNGEMTVHNGTKAQFNEFVDERCIPLEGTDEDAQKPEDNALVSLMRFLTAFFRFITRLFNGDFSFGK